MSRFRDPKSPTVGSFWYALTNYWADKTFCVLDKIEPAGHAEMPYEMYWIMNQNGQVKMFLWTHQTKSEYEQII